MADVTQRVEHSPKPPRRQNQRVAAGQDDFPDLRVFAYVAERRVEIPLREQLAVRPADDLAPKTKAAVDRADRERRQQHTIRVAMHDAPDRRVRVVADRIGSLVFAMLELGEGRHELPGDRVIGLVCVDEPGHRRRDGESVARRYGVQRILTRRSRRHRRTIPSIQSSQSRVTSSRLVSLSIS